MKTASKLMFVTMLLMSSLACYAQTHWTCNPNDYQYDMTAYLNIAIDEELIDPATAELAAFVGDECRGVAEPQDVQGYKYYYLRIRSNTASGEKISLKIYKDGEETDVTPDNPIVFESMKIMGMPSSPYIIGGSRLPGDANGDGRVSVSDITLIVQYLLRRNPANIDTVSADANGDGKVSVTDITTIVRIILKK